MISIVVHGILGTAYRQDIVLDGGSMEEGDIKSLCDIRHHLSTQYGDGTPTTGWALTPTPSGMWLSRVERAFDANSSPAYMMISLLIPRGQKFKDDRALGMISKRMILNRSKYMSQGIIQDACDWIFLKPLTGELENSLVPCEGVKTIYEEPKEGEVAYYQGELSQMVYEMWSGKFSRFGTVFCGKGLLQPCKEYPNVNDSDGHMEPAKGDAASNKHVNEDQKPFTIKNKQQTKKPIIIGVLSLLVAIILFLVVNKQCKHEPIDNNVASVTFMVKGISFAMNYVDGGSFMMGAANDNEDAKKWEKPQHEVTLGSYFIGESEVTQELWEAVMGSNPSQFKGKNQPVESVSYADCISFIEKLNHMTGENFRMPTEAEWEFAARGGIHSKQYLFSGSDDIDAVAWYWRNSGDEYLYGDYCVDCLDSLKEYNHCRTHPVKTKLPNELGLYDMTGNVIEWCSDWYGRYSEESVYNPNGPETCNPDKPGKVRRGGFYLQNVPSSRITYRMYTRPEERQEWLGFRLALTSKN